MNESHSEHTSNLKESGRDASRAARVSAEEIREQMSTIRNQFASDARQVEANFRRAIDWKSYLRNYPATILAAAAVVGFVLIPKRKPPTLAVTDSQLDRLAKEGKLQLKNPRVVTNSNSMGSTALNSLFSAAGKAAVTYALLKFEQHTTNQPAEQE